MSVMKQIKLNEKLTSRELLILFLILGAFFLWMASHETWHVLACSLQGFGAESDFHSFTICHGAERASLSGIFVYNMAPYLMGILLILVAWFWRPKKLLDVRNVLPILAVIDMAGNASGLLRRENDFTILAHNIPQIPWLEYVIIVPILILAFLYYFRLLKKQRAKTYKI